jgi:hypothetical protein
MLSETTAWMVGLGIVTLAIFPFALPGIVLTIVALVPLLLIGVAAALVVAIVALPILLVRSLGRRAIGAARPASPPATASRSS